MCQHVICLLRPAGSNFTSGALYSDSQRDAAAAAEKARLATLKANDELPLVYFDVAIKGQHVGRIHFVLFTKEAPRAGGHMLFGPTSSSLRLQPHAWARALSCCMSVAWFQIQICTASDCFHQVVPPVSLTACVLVTAAQLRTSGNCAQVMSLPMNTHTLQLHTILNLL